MVYGYARCSTNESRQDIDRQKRELKKIGVNENNIYWEYESGSKVGRVQLDRLLGVVQDGDTIVTTEVSRLSRSTKQLCEIIETAKDKHLKLVIGTFSVDCTQDLDPMAQGMIMMWAVFSEMEKAMISQRVKSGMANAKAKGTKMGRPVITIDNLPPSFIRHYPKLKAKTKDERINVTELAALCKTSRQTIYNYIEIYEGAVL